MIQNGYEEKEYVKIMRSLKRSFESKNEKKMANIRQYCLDNKNTSQKFLHLYYISDILLSKLQNLSYEKSGNLMRKYLSSVNSWTHYELVLFNNIMFIFSTEMIDAIINMATSNLEKYSQLKRYGNESIRMFLNVCFLLIQRKELKSLRKYLKIITSIPLSEDAIFERCSVAFLKAVTDYIIGDNTAEDRIIQALNVFKFTSSNNIYVMYYDLYEYVDKNREFFHKIIF